MTEFASERDLAELTELDGNIPIRKLPPEYPANFTAALAHDEICHHGLSLWLCADPINHYPRDL